MGSSLVYWLIWADDIGKLMAVELTLLSLLIIVLLALFLGLAVELDPGVKAVSGHP